MIALYKKELKSYLTSMIGYVFIAFVLVVVGIFFTAYNLSMGYPKFSVTMNSITVIYLITIPLLTMRIFAEETKQKTDQLLYTSPVSVGSIIIGKFLAVVTVFAIPMAIICLYPLILTTFGEVELPGAYTSILGFFLLGCAYISIGMFLSSITESQIIAAVLTFAALYVSSYLISGISNLIPNTAAASWLSFTIMILVVAALMYGIIKNIMIATGLAVLAEGILTALYLLKPALISGKIQSFLSIFNLNSRFTTMLNDILDVNSVVYLISVSAFFLFLTHQMIQKRRWN
ncbi:MAG TPA: ABC transporter permease [Candidatus Merdenecus merdavium]|nr:ABC transporter permease [Candidatus Merdenecus merdavium]